MLQVSAWVRIVVGLILIFGIAIALPNALPEIHSMVQNNIRKKGPILADGYKPGEALKKIVRMKPEEVINAFEGSL